jgi:hypothetical protein
MLPGWAIWKVNQKGRKHYDLRPRSYCAYCRRELYAGAACGCVEAWKALTREGK